MLDVNQDPSVFSSEFFVVEKNQTGLLSTTVRDGNNVELYFKVYIFVIGIFVNFNLSYFIIFILHNHLVSFFIYIYK